ncbi:hypothetical protein TTHT_0847 [Thermotomaculum hydrothermale]|uniref:histidine kinase n=1 Tax=Thermotomaculum hydrothermale TaxID=981385 RepID=A0A7R6PGY6_9BACT|nr:HAMP domain-containing sensor histidine kinase [Thermotomaculum hydrothermale]BBB32409.1 hypothetical protein TTHT_0847 [Thermotomaculum hydrothermale]
MKQKNFTLSIKTLYIILILIFLIIIFFQFYFLRNAQRKLTQNLILTHSGKNISFVDKNSLKNLGREKLKKLEEKGTILEGNTLYIKRNGQVVKVNLEETMVFKIGRNLIYLNVIFDLLLIWVALYFYFKIFVDISRANATIELSTNGKIVPEKMPEVDVEGVDRIIENFRTVYVEYLKTEKAVQRKTHFENLGLVSSRIIHDLKNSLAYILVMIYKANSLEPKKEVKDLLTSVDIKVNELRLALEEVLAALREGKDLKIENIDIEVLKNGFEKEFSLLTKSLGIDFKLDFDSSLLGKTISVNPLYIKSAVENLGYNSIKAVEKNKDKKMGIEFSKQGENLNITVWDNGEGVSEKIKENIFDTFVSGDGNGIGLGLNTVKEYMNKLGGKVSFKKENGLTKFILTVPFKAKKKEREL